MIAPACPCCGCRAETGADAHAILAGLLADDLDAALERGLLDADPCPACRPRCGAMLSASRDARHAALQARDRYRARQARLLRRAAARASTPPGDDRTQAALPDAAAGALARALVRAAQRRRP